MRKNAINFSRWRPEKVTRKNITRSQFNSVKLRSFWNSVPKYRYLIRFESFWPWSVDHHSYVSGLFQTWKCWLRPNTLMSKFMITHRCFRIRINIHSPSETIKLELDPFFSVNFSNMRQFNVHLNYQGPNKIVIFHGWIVDGLKINGQLHGGNTGNKTILHLQPGEKIKRIHGTRCRYNFNRINFQQIITYHCN